MNFAAAAIFCVQFQKLPESTLIMRTVVHKFLCINSLMTVLSVVLCSLLSVFQGVILVAILEFGSFSERAEFLKLFYSV